ncbi:hypothetical protein P7K49_009544 [Saguinus oedipus]|uniref:Uncharacterized protein n=1 Tax=Saguinus oedipus TaxID=9490 RepID=A0ABQ9VK94_SAGOE|nr:hypothetical protein P7K49_009544 [Saguinus oedipus]
MGLRKSLSLDKERHKKNIQQSYESQFPPLGVRITPVLPYSSQGKEIREADGSNHAGFQALWMIGRDELEYV